MMVLLKPCADDYDSEAENTKSSHFLKTFIQSHQQVKHQDGA